MTGFEWAKAIPRAYQRRLADPVLLLRIFQPLTAMQRASDTLVPPNVYARTWEAGLWIAQGDPCLMPWQRESRIPVPWEDLLIDAL